MNPTRAFFAGVLGGLAMTLIMALVRLIEIPIHLEVTLGSLFGLDPMAAGTWILGFATHLIISGLIGLIYALGFEKIPYQQGAEMGVLFSFVHIIIAGLLFGLLPVIHPFIPDILVAPGAFMTNLAAPGIVLFIMLHMIYGIIVGGVYSGQARRAYQEPLPA